MLRNSNSSIFVRRFFSSDFTDTVCRKSFPALEILSKPKSGKPNCHNCNGSKKLLIFSNSQITQNGRKGNLEEAESVFNRMAVKDVVSWTALLTACADNGEIGKARSLFEKMPERNAVSWNAMITAYVRNLQIAEAFELFSKMPCRNVVSYTAMITGFVSVKMLSEAENLYYEMPLTGRDPITSNALISGYLKADKLEEAVQIFEGMLDRDVVSWSSMVDGYCNEGRIDDARVIFDMMPQRNVVSWTAMINGYFKVGMWEEGFTTFLKMRQESVGVNSTTLTVILDACANLGRCLEGIQVHGSVISLGFEWDSFVGNSIISMYSGLGWMDAAKATFTLMTSKNTVSWNILIAGYVQNGKIEEAYALFGKMPQRDVVSWTAMVVGFMERGQIEESISLFEGMPQKDDVSWAAIISGLVGNEEYECAFLWYIRMAQEGMKPNSLTLSSMLSASASLAILNQGSQIHACAVKTHMGSDISVKNSLISMYAKCGNVNDAYVVFSSIKERNLITMNSMITGFAQHGFGLEALELFREVENIGCKPNEITFLGVLSACVHVGLVEEGLAHFESMRFSYCVDPGPYHYACMVDLLGRAGLLKEAIALIDSMPFKPHAGIWGALLGASKIHKNLSLAKLAAQHLLELEPGSATAYTVLSNMYSETGLSNDERELRTMKKSRRVKKNPGCSWIILKDKVHLFHAGDQSNAGFEEIHSMLRNLGINGGWGL